MNKGVYAGSFDPITKGHMWVIEQASTLDKLVIAAGIAPEKRGKYTFSVEERVDMITDATKHIPNIEVTSMDVEYLHNFVVSVSGTHLIRGIRSVDDFRNERILKDYVAKHNPEISFTYFIPPIELRDVSSSFVKGLVGYNNWEFEIEDYVTKNVYDKLLSRFRGFESRWEQLWQGIGAKGDPTKIYDIILKRYSESHRHHHGMSHLAHCFRAFDNSRHLCNDSDRTEYNLFMHDLIYNILADNLGKNPDYGELATYALDNEEKSVEFACQVLEDSDVSAISSKLVREDILASKHSSTVEDQDTKLFLDIDIAVLGSPPAEYDQFEYDIRQEFNMVPEQLFRSARSNILKGFLERQSIYLTGDFEREYGLQARKNLERTVDKLC